jgi:hypothetical protein
MYVHRLIIYIPIIKKKPKSIDPLINQLPLPSFFGKGSEHIIIIIMSIIGLFNHARFGFNAAAAAR